jgi:hypothetical protein
VAKAHILFYSRAQVSIVLFLAVAMVYGGKLKMRAYPSSAPKALSKKNVE